MSEVLPTPDFSHLTDRDWEEVYEPREDTFLLVDALERDMEYITERRPLMCFEVGSGSGVVSAAIGKVCGSSAMIWSSDINLVAAGATRKTLSLNGISHSDVICADLVHPMVDRIQSKVDLLIVNPPYVPTGREELHQRDITASWAGGLDGREVIDRVLPLVPKLLSSNGLFYLVCIERNNPGEIASQLALLGLRGECVRRRNLSNEHLRVWRYEWEQQLS